MNPPRTPIAFDSVPTWMSTRAVQAEVRDGALAARSRARREACASSTIMIAPCRSATSTRPGSGAMSPSMENTPSVISS